MPQPSVLVVDDERLLRLDLRFLLERDGWRVDDTGDQSSAFDFMNRFIYDLIVTDIRLPDGNGLEVLAYSRIIQPQAQVIILTASSGDLTEDEVIRLGGTALIRKPFGLAVLSGMARAVLGIHGPGPG